MKYLRDTKLSVSTYRFRSRVLWKESGIRRRNHTRDWCSVRCSDKASFRTDQS